MNGNLKTGTGRNLGIWPVLLILLAGVLIPSGCVLWFMNAAIRNESLAVRQRLTDVYRKRLEKSAHDIRNYWEQKVLKVKWLLKPEPAETFASLIRAGIADGVVIYDASGKVAYPVEISPASQPVTPAWTAAEKLEFAGASRKAAEAYAKIAADSKSDVEKALSLQARARCLIKAGDKKQAIAVLGEIIELGERENADPQTLAVSLNSRLLRLQLMKDADDESFDQSAGEFAKYLEDYTRPIASSQRRFLMRALSEMSPDITFDMLPAEELSNEYAENHPQEVKENILAPSGLPEVWRVSLEKGKIVLLLRQREMMKKIRAVGRLDEPAEGIRMELIPPGQDDSKHEPFLKIPVDGSEGSWELAMYLVKDPFAAAAKRQKLAYLWIGSTVIFLIAILSLFVAHYINRQMKLTRLKNDFIATVSHELKTPLASMRVLVDTLLDGRHEDARTTVEYLRLIAGENERLSRLIDNFLSFSRMERNKRAFNFESVGAADVVETAVESLRERFSGLNCKFETDVEKSLPDFIADKDAVVTIILNLLDNAWKYSGEYKHIVLRVFADNGNVCFSVSDNGIGMDRKTVKRIFQRFYQADQSLSRSSGGCGLGLSIVKFILDAHGGHIEVKSHPGKGSVFTAVLPVSGPQKSESREM